MAVIKKPVTDKNNCGNAIVSDKVGHHGNDTFVVKKVEEAKAFLQKNGFKGLPKQVSK